MKALLKLELFLRILQNILVCSLDMKVGASSIETASAF